MALDRTIIIKIDLEDPFAHNSSLFAYQTRLHVAIYQIKLTMEYNLSSNMHWEYNLPKTPKENLSEIAKNAQHLRCDDVYAQLDHFFVVYRHMTFDELFLENQTTISDP